MFYWVDQRQIHDLKAMQNATAKTQFKSDKYFTICYMFHYFFMYTFCGLS